MPLKFCLYESRFWKRAAANGETGRAIWYMHSVSLNKTSIWGSKFTNNSPVPGAFTSKDASRPTWISSICGKKSILLLSQYWYNPSWDLVNTYSVFSRGLDLAKSPATQSLTLLLNSLSGNSLHVLGSDIAQSTDCIFIFILETHTWQRHCSSLDILKDTFNSLGSLCLSSFMS